ncbi:MAG: hypothetical protein QXO71_07160 [Candidatus Jordarchaeaceae archaeon]
MLERAPYEQPDTGTVMDVIIGGIKDEEKLYGPAFTARIIKYTLQAIASQTGEEPPKDIETLEQLKEYLLSKLERLSFPPYYILLWAEFVTAKKFEGSLGAGYRISHRGIVKKVAESEDNMKLQEPDIDQLIVKLYQLAVEKKVAPQEVGYRKNEDGSIDTIYGNCYFFDACELAKKYGILQRSDGQLLCGLSTFVCQFLRMTTGYEWDYSILEISKARCMVRCFII